MPGPARTWPAPSAEDCTISFQKHCPGCFARKSAEARCPHCGYDESAPRAPILLPFGTVVGGRYRIGRDLGREPSGPLYLGWDMQTLQRVAIKEFLTDHGQAAPQGSRGAGESERTRAAAIEDFVGHGERLAALRHPNLLRVHGVLRRNDRAYWVLGYYEGRSLAAYFDDVAPLLRIDVALGIARALAAALGALHAAGLLHRRVSPRNVHLAAGRAVLVGYDSLPLGHDEQNRAEAAPESPEAAAQGPWTDVYGLAATLYRGLIGRPLTPAPQRLAADPLADDMHFGRLAPALRELLRCALALRPQERLPDMAAFVAALDAVQPAPDVAAEIAAMSVAPAAGPEPRIRPPEIAEQAQPEPDPLRHPLSIAAVLSILLVWALVSFDPGPDPRPGEASRPLSAQERALLPRMIPVPAASWTPLVAGAAVKPVDLAPFRISRSEITVAQFGLFVRHAGYANPAWQEFPCVGAGEKLDWANPGFDQAGTFPVICVSAMDAAVYARWLARQTGRDTRLPTEAEWEYAAAGGRRTRYWWGEHYVGHFAECADCPPRLPRRPTYVGARPANAFGLVDTAANVREWTCSLYAGLEAGEYARCAAEISEATQLSVRGGSWQEPMAALATGYRRPFGAPQRNVWTGFRVVEPGGP